MNTIHTSMIDAITKTCDDSRISIRRNLICLLTRSFSADAR